MYYLILVIVMFFLFDLYKETVKTKTQNKIMQLMMEGLFDFIIYSHFIEYHNKTDKAYEKLQLYRFLINKFESQFSEKAWDDFFIKNQKRNYNLFVDSDYGMEPLRSAYLPLFILCLYKYPETRHYAENILNNFAVPLKILAEIKAIISHAKFNEINDDLSWVP